MWKLVAIPVAVILAGAVAMSGGMPPGSHPRAAIAEPDSSIPYPTGFRQWAHVKSEILGPQHPGFATNGAIHHIYANPAAMAGYVSGRFPDGSIIVADFVNPRDSANVIKEGTRNRIDVMVKHGARFAATGGWGFERFRGDSRTDRLATPEVVARCYACHTQQLDRDFVFSTPRP